MPEDLFRYASKGVRSYEISSKNKAYFSIDGGSTFLAEFNNLPNGGDKGDWALGSPAQAQNAYAVSGVYAGLTVEKTVLDVIGYNLVKSSPSISPSKEPSSQLIPTTKFPLKVPTKFPTNEPNFNPTKAPKSQVSSKTKKPTKAPRTPSSKPSFNKPTVIFSLTPTTSPASSTLSNTSNPI